MALQIPGYPDPRDQANPLVDAYAWLAGLGLDLSSGQGRITLNIHPREAAWQDRPVDQLAIALGQVFGPGVAFPTLDELMADAQFAAAYATIGAKLYAAAVASHPALAGAVEV